MVGCLLQVQGIDYSPAYSHEGSVKLFLDKPVQAKSIRVIFSCHEWDQKQEPTKLLSVESVIWSQSRYTRER